MCSLYESISGMGLVCFFFYSHYLPFMTTSPLLPHITLKHRFLNYTIRAEMPTSVSNDRREKQIVVFFSMVNHWCK